MKKRMLLWLLVLALVLAGCGAREAPPETTAPTTGQTTAPAQTAAQTQPTPPPTTQPPATQPSAREDGHRLSSGDLELYQLMFADPRDPYALAPINWYNMALCVSFSSPEDLDLDLFFNNGFDDERSDLTEAEEAFLSAQGVRLDHDLYRLPVEKMDAVLRKYFGLTLEQTNGVGLDDAAYDPETGCYYMDPGGYVCAEDFVFTDGYYHEASEILRLYYTDFVGREFVITMQSLRPQNLVGYHILSNLPAED